MTLGRNPFPDERLTYMAMHKRLQRQRGSAKSLNCEHYLEEANSWAYVHGCKDEKIDTNTKKPRPFCPHTDHYIPLCMPCHKVYDGAKV